MRDLFSMLTSLRRLPSSTLHEPESVLSRGRALADRELAQLEERLSFFEVGVVRALAERAQRFSKLREALWTTSSDALSMARIVALEIDRRLLRVNPKLEPGAVFFCTHEELMAALATGRPEVDHLVNLRRAELCRDLRRADPPPMYMGTPILPLCRRGSGLCFEACPRLGFARGTARVIREMDSSLAEIRPGDILRDTHARPGARAIDVHRRRHRDRARRPTFTRLSSHEPWIACRRACGLGNVGFPDRRNSTSRRRYRFRGTNHHKLVIASPP
ncbi:MAG: hypothetical protein U0165_00160 [Polyangiaceae bacterium]